MPGFHMVIWFPYGHLQAYLYDSCNTSTTLLTTIWKPGFNNLRHIYTTTVLGTARLNSQPACLSVKVLHKQTEDTSCRDERATKEKSTGLV